MKIYYIIPAILAFTISCTTVKVTRVTPANNPEGLRYALGKPFIKVVPNPAGDGTYSAELIYLPDDNQVYAVKTSSFMTRYTMELNVDESGILKKVDLSKNTTSPAADIVNSVGELAKAELARNTKATEDAEKKLRDDIKANKDAQAKLIDAIEQKKIDLQVAKNEKESIDHLPNSDANKEKLRQLELNIKKMELEKKSLEDKLSLLQQEALSLAGSANTGVGKDETPKAHGPVLFQIVETPAADKKSHSLKLEAVKWDDMAKQKQFEAPLKPTAAALIGTSSADKPPAVTEENKSATFNAGGKATVIFTFDKPVEGLVEGQSRIINSATDQGFAFSQKASATFSGTNMTIAVDKTKLPAGQYTLSINFKYKDRNSTLREDGVVTLMLKLNQ